MTDHRQVQVLAPPIEQTLADSRRATAKAFALNEALPGLVLNEPTALLLDCNNLYRLAGNHNFVIDYDKLRNVFAKRCDLRYCGAFSAIDRRDTKALGWASWMQEIGYEVKGKSLKKFTDSNGDTVVKGNMDVDITLAATELSPSFAHVILASCDGDFVPLVHHLRKDKYRKISVLGIAGPNWNGMSEDLADAADFFYNLMDIKDDIQFTGRKSTGQRYVE